MKYGFVMYSGGVWTADGLPPQDSSSLYNTAAEAMTALPTLAEALDVADDVLKVVPFKMYQTRSGQVWAPFDQKPFGSHEIHERASTMQNLLDDPRYFERRRMPKWNIEPTVIEEPKLMKRLFPELTKNDHHVRAVELLGQSFTTNRALLEALQRFNKAYGAVDPNDPDDHEYKFLSGGAKQHWPSEAKQLVRDLNNRFNLERGASLSHWIASGRKPRDWTKMRDSKR